MRETMARIVHVHVQDTAWVEMNIALQQTERA